VTRLPLWLRLPLAALVVALNTLIHVPIVVVLAIVKAALPVAGLRRTIDRWLMAISESWIAVNSALIDRLTHTRVVLECEADLNPRGHYLVVANHQSWVDIPILQKVLNRKIPLLRFFLKSQLFWVPLLGLAWWALDFPFMKRYTQAQIKRNPKLAGRDTKATRKACAKFKDIPVSVINFVEGTRFSDHKHSKQGSSYQHLLRPKAGGVAFVLDAMGNALDAVLDITVVYPDGRPTMLDLFANRVTEIRVHVQHRPIPAQFEAGDKPDAAALSQVRQWVNTLWGEKDRRIAETLATREIGKP